MENLELKKAIAHKALEIADYEPRAVVTRSILNKITGNITLLALDRGVGFASKIDPFDTFIHAIGGEAEIIIDGKTHFLLSGAVIIIPAHNTYSLRGNGRVKLLVTVIKSGYE